MINQDTRRCDSKYHVGNRNVSSSLFYPLRSGNLSNQCTKCKRETTLVYQRTEHGKHTKHEHYSRNVEVYRVMERGTRAKLIATDGGVSYLFVNAKHRAKRYKLPFTINSKDVIIPAVCPVLQIPLLFTVKRTRNTPSLDRIDNTKGYVPGNVQVISWGANNLKRNLSLDDIQRLHRYLLQFLPKEQLP